MNILFRHRPGILGKSRSSNNYSSASSNIYPGFFGFQCCNETAIISREMLLVKNSHSQSKRSIIQSYCGSVDHGYSR
jgi:hypothetical protein